MLLAVSGRNLIEEIRFHPMTGRVGFVVDKVAVRKVFPPSSYIFLHQYHSTKIYALLLLFTYAL